MNHKTRKVLLAITFGVVQLVLLYLLVVLLYYVGHTEFALGMMKYKTVPNTFMFAGAGFVTLLGGFLILALVAAIGFLLYHWGNFTLKQASKVDIKVRNKLYTMKEAKRTREEATQQWEV